MVEQTPVQLRFGVPGSQLPTRRLDGGAAKAERARFDSIWWADRLMGWLPGGPHSLLDPVAVIGAAAQHSERLLLGTAVIDPLRRHPAQLAQTALSLQHLCAGRFLLGAGCGEAAGTLPYGIDHDRPVARLEEALEVMRLLWSTPAPVDFDGRYFSLRAAVCGLSGVVEPPPVWLAAHGPRTLRLTGRVADGWLPTGHGAAAYREDLATIREAATAAGRDANAVEPGVFLWVVAADSRERARRLLAEPSLRALGLLLPQGTLSSTPFPNGPWNSLVPTEVDLAELAADIDVDELADVLPHGSSDDIADTVAEYVAAGARHLVLCDLAAMADEATGLDSPFENYGAVRDRVVSRTTEPARGS